MIKLGLLSKEKFWKLDYHRKNTRLEKRLSPHLVEVVRQVVIKGVER